MSVDQLRPYVRRLAERASERTYNWMLAGERSPEDLITALSILSGVYAQSAGILTAAWYEDQDEDSRFAATMDDDLPEEKVASISHWVFAGPQMPENRARVAAHRLVFDAARRTVFVNATAEGVGIARHESATECKDCQRAASRTERHVHSGSEDVDQEFHPMCEGLFVPVRKGVWTPPDHMSDWPT